MKQTQPDAPDRLRSGVQVCDDLRYCGNERPRDKNFRWTTTHQPRTRAAKGVIRTGNEPSPGDEQEDRALLRRRETAVDCVVRVLRRLREERRVLARNFLNVGHEEKLAGCEGADALIKSMVRMTRRAARPPRGRPLSPSIIEVGSAGSCTPYKIVWTGFG
jgi:hypothetical protein